MNQFDYIIVGAGSAGCVLANRLSADPSLQVLVLEAGKPDKGLNIRIPAAFSKLFGSKYDWHFHSAPQSQLKDRSLFLPRGKMLGGSSSMNAMIYIRGNPVDYDGWARLGNKGWAFKEVLPFFLKAESQQDIHDAWHGREGLLTVANPSYTNPLTEIFLQAIRELGFSLNPDFNGARQEGFGHYQVTQKKGSRESAATAYLHPVRQRRNLHIITGALAQRVILESGRATAVEFEKDGKVKQMTAKREIILCGGAYKSPQLLMLSGIGRGEELIKYGIPVRHHLPGVGKNLQDHLAYSVVFESHFPQTLDASQRFPAVMLNMARFLTNGEGPLTSNVAEAGGFFRTHPEEPAPNQQIHFCPGMVINHGRSNPKGKNGYSILGNVLLPGSRGSVRLASARPYDSPVIDPRFLSEPIDLERSIAGFRLCMRIGMCRAFGDYRKGIFSPGYRLDDEQAIADFIRGNAFSLYHPVGTCKMGKDPMAVVNSRLQVYGTRGLRVADASIMPTIPQGNTNAPTIMIAEKAADMILRDNAGSKAIRH